MAARKKSTRKTSTRTTKPVQPEFPTPSVILAMGFEFATPVHGTPHAAAQIKPDKSYRSPVSDALNADHELCAAIAEAIGPVLETRGWRLTNHNGHGIYCSTMDCRIGDPVSGSPLPPASDRVVSVSDVFAEKTSTPPASEASEPESTDYMALKRADLVEICKERGLTPKGTKAELAEMLTDADAA
jgi:hypothetical protein